MNNAQKQKNNSPCPQCLRGKILSPMIYFPKFSPTNPTETPKIYLCTKQNLQDAF